MTLKSKIYFAIICVLGFIGHLILLGYIAATAVQAAENTAEPQANLSALRPSLHPLRIVS